MASMLPLVHFTGVPTGRDSPFISVDGSYKVGATASKVTFSSPEGTFPIAISKSVTLEHSYTLFSSTTFLISLLAGPKIKTEKFA